MKLLFCEWGSYMQEDLHMALQEMGIEVRRAGYTFDDSSEDDYFYRHFGALLEDGCYDGVITLNYYPVLARVCCEKKTPYIAWVYDCPFDVREPEKTLGLATNHVFFFDGEEYKKYKDMGFDTVYHLELAVNTDRLDRIVITEKEKQQYTADISFVGSLYGTEFPQYYAGLNEYQRGYVNALMEMQSRIYGTYFLRECVEPKMIREIKERFSEVEKIAGESDKNFSDWIFHILASEITRRERITILLMLSKRCQVKLYTHNQEPLLSQTIFCGTARSFEETPKIYRSSKINLNITLKEIASGISLRVLDILGAGGFLLTNWQKEIAENFIDGRDLVMYDSVEDAVEKAMYYLQHEEERCQIAENGRKAVEKFSYHRQLEKIFQCVYGK
ncbi:MAG: glycosyltransferase [Lachnospiraceae bacterium]|nr:glycosyltransferase [Lachnospiraceae bacterium]